MASNLDQNAQDLISEILATPAFQRLDYTVREINQSSDTEWRMKVARNRIQQLWVYDQREFERLNQHLRPTKVGRLCAGSWLNVVTRKEVVYEMQLLPCHPSTANIAATLVKLPGWNSPAVLLDAQDKAIALSVTPRIVSEGEWQVKLRSGESVGLRAWLNKNQLYNCRIH